MIEPVNPKNVGYRIRDIRKNKLGLSMSAFAKEIDDKSKSGTISNWETGKNLPNNERLKRIAELGETSVEYLLTGREVRDLNGNLIPENLRLFDCNFINYYENKLENSPVRVIYSFFKISKDDKFYYCGIRSSVVLGSVDLSMRKATITILSESLEEDEFYNSADLSNIDFDNDSNDFIPFINCDDYLNSASLGNKDFRTVFLNDSMDRILNIVKQDNEMPFDDIDFNGNFHYFKRGTTRTISLIIGK